MAFPAPALDPRPATLDNRPMPVDISKLGPRDQALIKQFRQMKARMERQKGNVQWRPMLSVGAGGHPNFDLSKADPDCVHCSGKGARVEVFEGQDGEPDCAKIICRCVDRNGGVNRDAIPGGSPIEGASDGTASN